MSEKELASYIFFIIGSVLVIMGVIISYFLPETNYILMCALIGTLINIVGVYNLAHEYI
jgi:uncharacterized membrane protein HdeD (DUF308 family)